MFSDGGEFIVTLEGILDRRSRPAKAGRPKKETGKKQRNN